MEEGRELPVGWEVVRLEDIGAWGSGGTPKRTNQSFYANGTIPWLVIGDLNDGLVTTAASSITEEALNSSAAKVVPRDSLLVAMYGSIGKLGITGFQCATNQAIAHCKPFRDLIELQYLFNALMHVKEDLIAKGQGGAQQNISQGILRDQQIPLAPLNEQHRIAAKLDTTLAAVEACRQRLDGVAAILKRFRQAVLTAATSGELTREWREERGATMDDWSQKCLSDVVIDIEAGLNVLCEERPPSDGERGLVKISSVTWGVFDEDESKTLSAGHDVSEKNRIKAGDFLISRANTIELVGACVIVHKVNRTLYLSDKVLRLLMPEECKPWILMCLRSKSGREQIETFSSGNQLSMRNLSQKSLLSIRVPLPPPEEVEAAVTATNQLHALADQLEARLTAARKVVDRLTPALLAKAFRGELVPQDPGDEPASVLLERIRAARQAEAGAGKPSRRGRPKAAAIPDQLPLDAAPVPPDFLAGLLRECGPLSERALLAVSELEPQRFQQQLYRELESGTAREVQDNGQVLLEAVG